MVGVFLHHRPHRAGAPWNATTRPLHLATTRYAACMAEQPHSSSNRPAVNSSLGGYASDSGLKQHSRQQQQQLFQRVHEQYRQPVHEQQYRQPQPLPGAHPRMKYAQMGHSSYGRGAPHVCYMQVGSHGLFYSKVDAQQQQQQQHHHHPQQQQSEHGWSQLATRVTHTAASLWHTAANRRGSMLAAAAAGGDAAQAGMQSVDQLGAQQPAGGSSSSSNNDAGLGPEWPALVLQGLLLAAALLAAGMVLRHFLRGVVAALVACYSGLPFKA